MTLRELLEDHGVAPDVLLDQQIGGVPQANEPWIGATIDETGVTITIQAGPTPYEGKETSDD